MDNSPSQDLHIGIDASRSVGNRPTGTELYSRYLIEALLERAPDRFSFCLYFNRSPRSPIAQQRSEIRIMPFPRLWTHFRLSLEMLRQPPDLLFVPAHVLPIVHPRRSVVTVHDLGYWYFPEAHLRFQRWYLDRTTRWHTRTAAHLLADSEATKRDLIDRYHTRPDRISVAYPGLDPTVHRIEDQNEIARVKAKYHIDGDYLLYLGTLQPRKNLSRLITAFHQANIASQSPIANIQLLIAGKIGWQADPLFKQVAELGLSARVRFPGYVDALDKSALLTGAQAFVFPSLYEGFGFPILEAMACGTPVLCSNTSSLPEVAGAAAVMINPLDVASIAKGLIHILDDRSLCGNLIDRGYAQVRKFTWSACADVALTVFEQVLSASH